MCPRNLVRALSADLDGFLRGLALWFNEEIETGRWGNGTELFPCEWEKEEWDGPPTEIGALDTVYLGW